MERVPESKEGGQPKTTREPVLIHLPAALVALAREEGVKPDVFAQRLMNQIVAALYPSTRL